MAQRTTQALQGKYFCRVPPSDLSAWTTPELSLGKVFMLPLFQSAMQASTSKQPREIQKVLSANQRREKPKVRAFRSQFLLTTLCGGTTSPLSSLPALASYSEIYLLIPNVARSVIVSVTQEVLQLLGLWGTKPPASHLLSATATVVKHQHP